MLYRVPLTMSDHDYDGPVQVTTHMYILNTVEATNDFISQ